MKDTLNCNENIIIRSYENIIDLNKDKLMIAGPCAIESYEQLLETAKFVKKTGVNVLRGGAYKPRTSPDSFQGLLQVKETIK